MTYETIGGGTLDYFPCRYGDSKLLFRGPRRDVTGDYVAFLGGTETYGKYIPKPFPELVEAQMGLKCINFGLPNAGVDVFANDASVLDVAHGARATVVQVMGASNLNNRFYSVHPRRNDRFLAASQLMQTIFREVDFTEFNFTGHMLRTLETVAPERFQMVVDEVQQAWLARMQLLLNRVGGKKILLWFSDHLPEQKVEGRNAPQDPFAVTRQMIDRVGGMVQEVVEVEASPAAMARGTEGMVFGDLDRPAALGMLGPMAHDEVTDRLVLALTDLP